MSAEVVALRSWDRAASVAAALNPPPPPFEDIAFPFAPVDLRDLFAAFALSGILANSDATNDNYEGPADLAEACYVAADAMLVERKNRQISTTVH